MSYNYNLISESSGSGNQVQQNKEFKAYIVQELKSSLLFRTFLVLFLSLFGVLGANAQTTLINSSQEITFGNGPTDWKVANDAINKWYVGPLQGVSGTCAYVSQDGGATNTYKTVTPIAQNSYFYRDIVVPAGETKIALNFKWKNGGETTADLPLIYAALPSVTPMAGQALTGDFVELTNNSLSSNSSAYTDATFYLPTKFAGNTVRIIFMWKNDFNGGGIQPPASIDNISLISSLPGTVTSAKLGNWNDPTTWIGGAVPSFSDTVIIDSNHIVSINVSSTVQNITIKSNAELNFAATGSGTPENKTLTLNGNLDINSTGTFKISDTNTIRQTFNIAGNLTNNGTISVPGGSGTSTDNTIITFNGSTPQTISGTGSFGSYLQSVTFNNTSTLTPNIIWDVNNVVIARLLTLNNARVSLNGKKIFLGNTSSSAISSSISITAGTISGFLPGGTISRYMSTTATGSAIAAGVDPTSPNGQFPIITSNGLNRSLFINRITGTSATQLAVNYTDDNTVTTLTGVTETGYTINKRLNSNWTVNVDGVSATANTYKVAMMGANGLFPANGNSRILYANTAIAGTHETGTLTPSVHRAGLNETNLTQEPLYIGLADADNSTVFTVASGDWNNPAIWNTIAVPVSSAIVVIQPGHSVTVAGNVTASNVTVALGGALTINGGATFNLGDTSNKTRIMNVNGTMTVNNGSTLNIYGSLKTNLGSTFIQNGGTINVDINSGTAGTSLATGQKGLLFTAASKDNLKLIAGNINLLNPHILGGSDLVMEVIQYGSVVNQSGISHTLHFTDDQTDSNNVRTSTHTNGIQYSATSAIPFVFSNVSVETSIAIGITATPQPNRAAKSTTTAYIGNLSFDYPGAEFSTGTLYLSGNLTNTQGILRTTGTFGFAAAAVNPTQVPVTTSQTVQGIGGTFYRLASGAINSTNNEHFAALTINNSSTSGVTFDFAPSMSGTLTLSNGKLNLPSGGSLLMTAVNPTINPTITNPNSYINGGFQRSIPISTNANTFLLFPIGTADAYRPMWIASNNAALLSAVSVRAVSNSGNPGTLENMATTSWVTAVTGTTSQMFFRLGDSAINKTNILASSATVNGTYLANFGNSAIYTAGNPNQLQTVNPVSGTNFSTAITYANLASCTGTPTPGATLTNNVNALSKTINLGDELTFSLENSTIGGQVTYTWQKSANNTNYTNIDGANTASYTIQPTEAVYYRCMVNCAGVTAASNPVQITFPNNITATTNAERCGDGSLTLQATGSAGTTVSWYATPQGGLPLATTNSYTTLPLTKTTDFYAAAETTAAATFSVGPKTYLEAIGTSATDAGFKTFFSTINAVTLSSIDVYPGNTGVNVFTYRDSNGVIISTKSVTFTQTQVDLANFAKTATPVPVTVVLDFPITAGISNASLECDKGVFLSTTKSTYIFPYVNSGFQIVSSVIGTDSKPVLVNDDTPGIATSRMRFFNWRITSDQAVVSSARAAVRATINQTTQIGLSASETNFCGTDNPTVMLTTPVANYDTYTWTPNTGVTGDATNGWIFSPAITTTYTLKAEKGSCTDTETFKVNAGPVVTDQTICGYILGEAISGLPAQFGDATVYNLTPKPSTTIKWYADVNATTPLANSTKLINGNTYYVSQNLSCGESLKTAVKVTLNTPAAPTGNNTQYFCTTGTIAELTATGVGITWKSINAVDLNPSTSLTHNTHYIARQNIDGCPSAVALDVVALDKQKAPLADAIQNFCGTEPRTLTDLVVVGAPSAVINWYSTATSTIVLPLTTTLVNNTTYYATQDNSATACPEVNTNRVAVKATINPIPAAPTGAVNQTVENGATIAALSVTGENVVWYETEANAIADVSPLSSTTVLNDATYYAMQTVNGCRSIAPLAVNVTVTVLSVNNFNLAGLKFYPNPVTDFVNISNATSISTIKVFNMLGQRVISVTPNSLDTKVDMSTLPRGTYLLEIHSEGNSAKIKLVKN